MSPVLIVVIVVVVLIAAFFATTYNSLIQLKNRVKDQWAQIGVQLKRRFDLIPNLIETVKGYTKHESETLENVVKARNTYVSANTPADAMKAEGELEKAISKLFALAESYPELKANTNFLSLQEDLTKVENELAGARKYYNAAARNYNYAIAVIPKNIVAKIFGHKAMKMFTAEENQRQNVKVEF